MKSRRSDDFESRSPIGWLRYRFSRAWRRLLEAVGQDDLADEFGGGTTIGQRLTAPFRVFWAFLGFLLTGWSASRSTRSFFGALPALVAAGLFLGLLTIAYNVPFRVMGVSLPDPAGKILGSMMALRQNGVAEKDPEQKQAYLRGSEICAEHLVFLRPKDPEIRFELGLARDLVGKKFEARNVMQSLAPETEDDEEGAEDAMVREGVDQGAEKQVADGTEGEEDEKEKKGPKGYSRAHLWLANDLTTAPDLAEIMPAAERNSLARKHLENVDEIPDDDRASADAYMAQLRLAALLIEDGEKDEAIKVLLKTWDGQLRSTLQLKAMVLLARLYKESGNEAELDNFVDQSLKKCNELSIMIPDSVDIWQAIVQLHLINDRFEPAAQALQSGMLATTKQEVRQQLNGMQSALFIHQSEQIPDIVSRENFLRKLLVLCSALQLAPRDGSIARQLVAFVEPAPEFPDREIWLREAYLETNAPTAMLDVVIGLREMLDGKFREGQGRWAMSYRANPAAVLAINSLLLALDETRVDDAELMANLASVAIESFPEQYLLVFTRARFMNRAGKLEQAVLDLEKLLPAFKDSPEPRELLAEVLEKKGDSARAAELRAEAKSLREKNEALAAANEKTGLRPN